MKIKQVEELVGINSKNIRFYENQGLLTPERADNGYREYRQSDIEILKKIKLFRKLGISLEQIKLVLGERLSLNDCLESHMEVLEKEKENLINMSKFSEQMYNQNASIGNLNADEWLEEMEKMEKEGIDFVDISKIDIHMKKKMGAAIGGVIMIIFMLFSIGMIIWANSMDPIPLGLLIFFIAIPVVIILCIAVALRSRFKEIEGGEEDEASKY